MQPGDKEWMSWIKAPVQVDDPDREHWDDQADVVAVGYGGAGACAALEARERGASVLIVERFVGGGATRLSGGVIYAGGGTVVQKAAGVEDSVDNMFAYLKKEIRGAVSDETLRRFCEDSASTVDWLMGHGVPYQGTLWPNKTIYPPKGYYLYFSGNESLPDALAVSRPAARGHRAVHPRDIAGMTGFAYFEALDKAVKRSGARLLNHAPVERLVVDRSGRVVGVQARVMEGAARVEHEALIAKWKPLDPLHRAKRLRVQEQLLELEEGKGTIRRIRAHGGVILSSGGFIHNWDMVRRVGRIDYKNTVRVGTAGDDGAGIRLGQTVGGATAHMGNFDNGKAIRPDLYTRGILIDERGDRFVNEMAYAGTIGDLAIDQGRIKLRVIINKKMRDQAIRNSMPSVLQENFYFMGVPVLASLLVATKSAPTIERLAEKLKIDPAKLRQVVDSYNRAAAGQEKDPFGKEPKYMEPLTEGPFYAVDQSVTAFLSPMSVFTTGGLVVDESSGMVKREDGSLVPGLYAAGRSAVGICSVSYVSGMSLGDCVFSGRRAARSIVASRAGQRDLPSREEKAA